MLALINIMITEVQTIPTYILRVYFFPLKLEVIGLLLVTYIYIALTRTRREQLISNLYL